MLIQVIDATGVPRLVTWTSQDQINDFSGVLGAPAVAPTFTPQQIAPANTGRAGFLFQNRSGAAMALYEDGNGNAPYIVMPGAMFPPIGYPIPTGAISVAGTNGQFSPNASAAGDAFTYSEWQNAPGN